MISKAEEDRLRARRMRDVKERQLRATGDHILCAMLDERLECERYLEEWMKVLTDRIADVREATKARDAVSNTVSMLDKRLAGINAALDAVTDTPRLTLLHPPSPEERG